MGEWRGSTKGLVRRKERREPWWGYSEVGIAELCRLGDWRRICRGRKRCRAGVGH